jgi:predicted homoserine dehydrogenase-like protein
MMYGLDKREKPIRVAVIGGGAMGKGLVYQAHRTPGIDCVAVADVRLERAIACCQFLHRDYRVVHTLDELHDTIRQAKVAVCEDGMLLAKCELVEVLIEASSAIGAGGQFAVTALEHGKHLVMMNAEADLLFGPYLMRLAQDQAVVYTSCDGDQHGVITRLIHELQFWDFELVMAGNMKGFLDRYANPTTIIPEADKRRLDYHMATAFTDGTKLCVEMALVANGLGLSALVPGMYGPRTHHVSELFSLFDFATLWQQRQPVVEYILGAEPGGGVFVVGYCDNDYQQSMLRYYKMGDGPFYLFYRPYHLCHVEAMACVVEAALHHRALLQPACGFRTNVYAYAKRDLHKGDSLDGLGGYDCYGLIENCPENEGTSGLPVCLAEDVTLAREVRKDEKIFMRDLSYDQSRADFALYCKAVEQSKRRFSCS